MGTAILLWCVFIGALFTAFLLSGMEAGVLALSRFRVRRQMRSGLRRAALLHRFLEDSERFLWTILAGNTLATVTAFSLAGIGLYYGFNGRLEFILPAFAVVVFLFFTLCDLLPKMLFQQHPNRLCLALAIPFQLLHIVLFPLVSVLAWFARMLVRLTGRESLRKGILSDRRAVRLAIQETSEILTPDERTMVNRVLELHDLTVRSITVPRTRAIGVRRQTPARELLEICRHQPVSRVPVWEGDGSARRTVGIVSLSTLLFAERLEPSEPVERYAKPPLEFREDIRLEEALRRMQRTRQRMAVVIGLDGRELGIVNLRDILKSIFGEMTL